MRCPVCAAEVKLLNEASDVEKCQPCGYVPALCRCTPDVPKLLAEIAALEAERSFFEIELSAKVGELEALRAGLLGEQAAP